MTKLKDVISKFFAYALAVAGASLVSIAVWTHTHAAEPIMENAEDIRQLTNDQASGFHISRDIRHMSKECADMKRDLKEKRTQKIQILISPNRDDPELIEVKQQLDNEIRDLEKEIEREEQDLHEAEIKESQLIARLSTA